MDLAARPLSHPASAPRDYASTLRKGLYTADERARRDATVWTRVQGVLAVVQFVVFAISVVAVLWALATGTGTGVATATIVLKTLILYTIMATGSIWEKVVFGRFLFASAFFWEDVVSLLVLALHTLFLFMLIRGLGSVEQQFAVALAAYAAYAFNAAQFLRKLRIGRRAAAGAAA